MGQNIETAIYCIASSCYILSIQRCQILIFILKHAGGLSSLLFNEYKLNCIFWCQWVIWITERLWFIRDDCCSDSSIAESLCLDYCLALKTFYTYCPSKWSRKAYQKIRWRADKSFDPYALLRCIHKTIQEVSYYLKDTSAWEVGYKDS